MTVERRNPYPGLRPFREDEEYLFFGRESQADAMVDKLARSRLLAVVGTSGSGKSSLVNCGLRPALHRGLMASAGSSWRMASLRPGGDPVRALAHSLAQDGVLFDSYEETSLSLAEIVETTLRMSKLGLLDIYQQAQLGEEVNLLIVVDQFEELFRYRTVPVSAEESAHDTAGRVSEEAVVFVNLLLELRSAHLPIYVALTMRSDFLGDCAELPGLPEAINEGQYLVPRMTREERRSAIAGPAAVGQAEISPVLVTRLVNDVGDNPDQLSILQHALNRTWACWEHNGGEGPLTVDHYEEIGTMARALDQHAEKAYSELDGLRSRTIAERIFKTLTDKGTDPRGIRRPTQLKTLCEVADANPGEVEAVIDIFRYPRRSFLMPPAGEPLKADSVVDISHESLMRVWSRLKRWANEEADSAHTYQRMVETAVLHAAGKASLWRDPELQLALDWREKEKPTAIWASRFHPDFGLAMEFLDKSKFNRDEERWKERRRRLRGAAVTLAAAILAAILSLLYANWQRADANRQRRLVRSALSEKEGLVLDLLYGENPAEALVYAIQATGQNLSWYGEVPRSVAAVLNTAVEWARERTIVAPPFESVQKTSDSRPQTQDDPDGVLVAAMAGSGLVVTRFPGEQQIRFFDVHGKLVGDPIETGTGGSVLLAISNDGSTIVHSEGTDSLSIRNGAGRKVGSIRAEAASVVAVAPDGSRVAAAGDRSVRVWATATTELHFSPPQLDEEIQALSFSPAGQILAAASGRKIVLWDLLAGTLIETLQGHLNPVHTLAFSHNEKLLGSGNGVLFDSTREPYASIAKKAEVRIWDLETLKMTHRLRPRGRLVRDLAFTDNDQYIVIGVDENIEIWEVNGQQLSPNLRGHSGPVTFIGVADATHPAHSTHIVSASQDGTLRYWDFPTQPSARIFHHEAPLNWATFSIDSRRVGTGGGNGAVTLWDVDGQEPQIRFEVDRSVMTLGFDHEGGAVGTGKGLWLVDHRGIPVADVGGPDVWALDFTPDGRFLITAGSNGTLYKWDRSHKKVVTEFHGHDGKVRSLDVSQDGREIVSAGDDGTVRLWDLATGNPLGDPLEGHKGEVVSVKFMPPDSQTIVSGGWDGTLRMWGHDRELRLTFKAHQGRVESVTVSPDGRYLASGGSDQVIRVWLPDGSLIGQFLAHEGDIFSIEFGTNVMPDASGIEQVLLSASWDTTAALWPSRLWKDDWESALRLACERLRHHPLLSETTSSVEQDACLTCEEFVWKEVVCSKPRAPSDGVPASNLWAPSNLRFPTTSHSR